MEKTPVYDLSQWAKTDRLLMEDFNADNAAIETALSKKLELVELLDVTETLTQAVKWEVPVGDLQLWNCAAVFLDLTAATRSLDLYINSLSSYLLSHLSDYRTVLMGFPLKNPDSLVSFTPLLPSSATFRATSRFGDLETLIFSYGSSNTSRLDGTYRLRVTALT